ncbi:DUF4274 domain-containing protein [Primorskyibacter sp. 2E107]|uniref:DUF4274 domain-containing protein n=1 Tax=Primorskyibacter sp. 2E107 TaxID=3403458 RepID=UPI003AF6E09C
MVYFPAAFADPESIGEYDSPEALLAAIPGAARAYRTLSDEYEHRVIIDLPYTGGDFLARAHYLKGSFHQTEYRLREFAQRLDERIRERDEARRAEKAAEAAKRDAWAMLPVDEKLAQVRAPRLAKEAELGVDGALIDWAGGHSSWGESSNRWGSFVNWLITKATPDDRHNLVWGMNWDHGTEVFMWIVQQPDTDIATVAKTIWQASASYHLREMSRADGTSYAGRTGLNDLDLIDEAVTRIRAGFYVPRDGHDPIGFEGPPIALGVSDDPLVRAAEDRLFPPILRRPIPGRPESELRNGLPKIYWDVVN